MKRMKFEIKRKVDGPLFNDNYANLSLLDRLACAIYSLIETAKQHELDPFAYLHCVLERAPYLKSEEDWDTVLPFYLDAEEIDNAFPKPPKTF
jgi:hypothetical protein